MRVFNLSTSSSPLPAAPSHRHQVPAGFPLRFASASTYPLPFRAFALIAALWLLAGDYLFSYFSSDDFMNLYQNFHKGWALLRGIALFWSGDVARPVGGLLYTSLYDIFGLHPFSFKLLMVLL